jgi:ubiquinone/menaquinone biosynthesis C-methylase UbiE
MLKHLQDKAQKHCQGDWRVDRCGAETLAYPNNSFDAIVSTLVLCSVTSPSQTLHEIHRVLRPGGKFYVIEHVLAKDRPHLIKWQKLFQPLWVTISGNCHLTRDTEHAILEAGFQFEMIDKEVVTGIPAIVSSMIRGIARK